MIKVKKPMKGVTLEDPNTLKYPVLASPKLDGFRCLKIEGKAVAYSLKPIANEYTRNYIEKNLPDSIDGELMLADPNATFNDISSALRKYKGEPDFIFHAFDLIGEEGFTNRLKKLKEVVYQTGDERLVTVRHKIIENKEQLIEYEELCLDTGYEGVIIRSVNGPYKQGRATKREGYLFKMKRFVDSEATILGFEEQMHNKNKATINEHGLTSRSTKKENMVPANTLGKFNVRDIKSNIEFDIGTGQGLTQELRKEIWDNQDMYKNEIVKYRYQEIGVKDKPRLPIWLGFRAKEDM